MSPSEPQQIPFDGVRVRYGSSKSYGELVAALLADIGDKPVPIDDIAVGFDSWESYEREVGSHVGPSGFMLFAQFDHGGWIKKAGIERKVLRVVLGNPLIADHDAAPRRDSGTLRARRTSDHRGGRRRQRASPTWCPRR